MQVGDKIVTSRCEYNYFDNASDPLERTGVTIKEAVVFIKDTDIKEDGQFYRVCKQCKREEPISYFGYDEKYLKDAPGIDEFCQMCYCC